MTTDTATPFRVHAFGAGVQSMTLLQAWAFDSTLMGRLSPDWHEFTFFPKGTPDLVVFADTQREPKSVYAAVDHAKALCEEIGVPLEVVSAGDLGVIHYSKNGTPSIFIPAFSVSTEWRDVDVWIDARNVKYKSERKARSDKSMVEPLMKGVEHEPPGTHGQLKRQCTERFKIEPMMARIKELAAGRPIELWFGMSSDEISRLRRRDPSDQVQNYYPLVLEPGLGPMTRNDCLNYLRLTETPAGKSACVFCPYRRDAGWARMKRFDPDAWGLAIAHDRLIRDLRPGYKLYVHEQRIPLEDVVFPEFDGKTIDLGLFDGDADMSSSGGCEEGYCEVG